MKIWSLLLWSSLLCACEPAGESVGRSSTNLDAAGDRLAPLVFYGDDGSIVTLGWIDQQSRQQCDFRRVNGQTYCLPLGRTGKTDLYADATCSAPVINGVPLPQTPVVDVKLLGVYHASSAYKGPSYQYSLALGCHEAPPCEDYCLALAPAADGEYVTGIVTAH